MLQTNLREIDVDMDVDQVADYIVAHGARAWLIGVGGIQAQYPTELAFHSKNLRLSQRHSGDLIADAVRAAHSRNLRLLARMDFSKISAQAAAEHPDWCYLSSTGDLQEHSGDLVSVCPSGGYYQERMFDILDEVCERYPIDGLFINWTTMNEVDYYKRYHGVCHCSNCQKRWLEYSNGLPLPSGPNDPEYAVWLRFSRDLIDNITARVRTFIARRLPDAGLILGKTADIMFHEANNAVGRELWHHNTSEVISTWTSYRPDVPVLSNSTTFMDMPYRMASEEPAHFAQYFLQCISRGGNPSTYMMGVPGKIPYLCMDVAGEILRFHKKWDAVYNGMHPCAKTALVRPDRAYMTASQFVDSLSEFRGLYSSMQEVHILFDVIAQEHLVATSENGGLGRYSVVVLPNVGKLNTSEADVLDNWVALGGRLVATGNSGVGDGGAVQLQSLPSKHQRAVISKRELLFSSYVAPAQPERSVHTYTGPIIPLVGTYTLYEWKANTRNKWGVLARAPFAPPEKAYGNLQVDQCGFSVGSHHQGKGIVIPFTIGRGYRELGLRVFRDLFTTVLMEEGKLEEQCLVDVAEQVEVTLNQNGKKTVLHMINMSGARKQNFGSHIPIAGGSVRVPSSAISAHALVRDEKLEIKDGLVNLPTIDRFEVVVVENN
ncbi:glycosyl hydrolase 6-domain-containing protein [Lophiotrema nucula]|uniref:Glycosyl hydrolase 6-domain-containing protein n=1 Tax=Lophiotrema nucula TaxID=690887 RepID=A0A6A5YPE7_9PLEO|nr:glycosyl hydrolase 6-domain-containing protein [Lophiotrema nucula]